MVLHTSKTWGDHVKANIPKERSREKMIEWKKVSWTESVQQKESYSKDRRNVPEKFYQLQ